MKTIFSPFNIKVLLHCHCSAERHPKEDTEGFQDTIKQLIEMGAVERNDPQDVDRPYKTTPKGAAWVAALCNTPPPIQAWVDQLGQIIEY